jgi:glycerophosphoryl diester phosphodiesterase
MQTRPIDTYFIAHGGFPKRYPENSLEGYLAAAQYNPYAVEMDVVIHPDTGELICYHPGGISSKSGTYTEEAIRKQINNGARFESLKKVLGLLPKDQKVLIDLKEPNEKVFRKLLEDKEISHYRIILGVRNEKDMELIQVLAPRLEFLALFSNPNHFKNLLSKGRRYFRLWEKDLTAERVKRIQAAGLEVWVTLGQKATLNSPRTAGMTTHEKLDRMVGLVDGILVNDIGMAREYKIRRGG